MHVFSHKPKLVTLGSLVRELIGGGERMTGCTSPCDGLVTLPGCPADHGHQLPATQRGKPVKENRWIKSQIYRIYFKLQSLLDA